MAGISSVRAVEVLEGSGRHLGACMRIGRKLPEYFNPSGLEAMRRSLAEDTLYVALKDDTVAGFATISDRKDGVAEILWLAVDPEMQGAGVGSALIERVEGDLAAQNVRMLVVKTLAEEADYQPYEATRRFYERTGFLHLDTIDPYPGWNGDPAAIYAKPVFCAEVG